MSDSEGDFSDELLELAGATEKKRRRQGKHKPSKRQRADLSGSGSDSGDDAAGSEEEDPNPYPLEGKYIDEDDRDRLMDMAEIERENILAQRQEEMQRILDKRNLDLMLKERTGGGEESVSKAAKRHHTQRGATKEKSRKLDELRAKRKAKDEKKRRTDSPKRDRSSSPMDMGSSDEEEEEGQFNKFEEEEEQDRKYFSKERADDDGPLAKDDLSQLRVSRNDVVKNCFAPWFADYITGAWVRYLIGDENGSPVYRVCEVTEVTMDATPYKVNDQLVDYQLKLRHGSSERKFLIDRLSNSPFTDREFDRLLRVCEVEKAKLPSRTSIRKKAAQMKKLSDQIVTENDVNAIIARKAEVHAKKNSGGGFTGAAYIQEKGRLMQARQLASKRNDAAEVQEIDAKLSRLLAESQHRSTRATEDNSSDILAKVNERNRKANIEAVRRAEHEAERRRRERRLAASTNGTPTPTGERLRVKGLNTSRPGTPGTPMLKGGLETPRSVSPLPPVDAKPVDPNASFEAAVLDTLEIDLGDF